MHERKVVRDTDKKNPKVGSLAARLTRFTFYFPSAAKVEGGQEPEPVTKDIPRTIGVYALKGTVARLFNLKPMKLRLIWETDEWDPVALESEGWIVSDDDSDVQIEEGGGDRIAAAKTKAKESKFKEKWVRREVELTDGIKDVGFWIEGPEAKVRVEIR